MNPRIGYDAVSIHTEACRIGIVLCDSSTCYIATDNGPSHAWLSDWSSCQPGPIEIDRDDERWHYYGLPIGIVRWRNVTKESLDD